MADGCRARPQPLPSVYYVSLDDLWHQVETGFGLRGDALEQLVLIQLGHPIFAQAQGGALGMRHRLDAARVDRLEVVDQGENSSQLSENLFRFGVVDLQAGELRDASDVVQGQQHGDGLGFVREARRFQGLLQVEYYNFFPP